jgi:hypothetical protein
VTLGRHDWAQLVAKREAYISRLNAIYAENLAKRQVTLVRGTARLIRAGEVQVNGTTHRAPHIVIATGGRPMVPALPGAELGIDSDGFFALQSRPNGVAIVAAATSPWNWPACSRRWFACHAGDPQTAAAQSLRCHARRRTDADHARRGQ